MSLPFDVYLITDSTLGVDLVAATRAVLAAVPRGRVALQLRAKTLPTGELVALARALREVTHAHGALLFVNERADVARLVGADGVHLPEQSMTPAEARAVLGETALVGVSCHDARGLTLAVERRATFATLGPFADSPGKGAPLGAGTFAALVRGAGLPVLALGGVGVEQVGAVCAAGACGIAVIRAVFGARDPAAAACALVAALDSVAPARR